MHGTPLDVNFKLQMLNLWEGMRKNINYPITLDERSVSSCVADQHNSKSALWGVLNIPDGLL